MKKATRFPAKGRLIETALACRAPYRRLSKYTMISTEENCDTSKS